MNDILVIGVLAVISGVETWKQMEDFVKLKQDFLKTFLDISMPLSDDTFNRVFSAIDTEQFEICFANWTSSLKEGFSKCIINIDGKTVRGAKCNGKSSPVHIV